MTAQGEFPFPELRAVLGYLQVTVDGRQVLVRPHEQPGQWECRYESSDGTLFSVYGPVTESAALQNGRAILTTERSVCWQRVWLMPEMPWKPRLCARRPGHAAFYA